MMQQGIFILSDTVYLIIADTVEGLFMSVHLKVSNDKRINWWSRYKGMTRGRIFSVKKIR